MKKVLVIILSLIAIANLSAQQSGKILIVSCDSLRSFDGAFALYSFNRVTADLYKSLLSHYNGKIERRYGLLPDSLEQYDAIFTDLRFLDEHDSVLIAKELRKLSDYLLTVGKLYIEVTDGTIYKHGQSNDIYNEYPLFKELTGLHFFGITSAYVFGKEWISGVDGYYTQGMKFHRNTNPAEVIATSGLSIVGEVENIIDALAWLHEKDKQKVVFHWPIVTEHYDQFIGKTVCDYFGLCTPLSVKDKIISSSAFSIRSVKYKSETNAISFHYELSAMEPLTISAFNILGQRIYYSYNAEVNSVSGELSLRLPTQPVSGGYYLRVTSKDNTQTLPYFVIH